MDNVVRSSLVGHHRKATVGGYTARDIQTWADLYGAGLAAGGASRGDIIHNATHACLRAASGSITGRGLGASSTHLGRQHQAPDSHNERFGPTILTCTPSTRCISARLRRDPGWTSRTSVQIRIFGAEPWSEDIADQIEKKLHLDAMTFTDWSESSVLGSPSRPGAKHGLHILEDHFNPEIIDP